jgi:hypothetical protein
MAVFKFGQYTQWTKKVATKRSLKYTNYDVVHGSKLFRSGMEQHEVELYYIKIRIRKQKTGTPAYRIKLLTKQPPTKYGITEVVLQT